MQPLTIQASESLSLYHLVRSPLDYDPGDKDARYPTILALHGHGSNERDLMHLSGGLQDELLWISGRGPVQSGLNAYDWYPVQRMGAPDPQLLEAGLEKIDAFITELLATYPIDPQRLFLMGFSQGTMMSLSYLLTRPKRVAGVIAQSGYIPTEAGLKVAVDQLKGKPVVMTHGLEDSRMPLAWARQSRDLLESYGVNVSYHEFHMDHEITGESLAAVYEWLGEQLGS
jgi:phospholipase/carboxylesterase